VYTLPMALPGAATTMPPGPTALLELENVAVEPDGQVAVMLIGLPQVRRLLALKLGGVVCAEAVSAPAAIRLTSALRTNKCPSERENK
jgi:hypothetical protein